MSNDRLLIPDCAFYNEPFTVRMPGDVDGAALERAFCEIIARHESLRATSADAPDGRTPRVAEPAAFHLRRVDLSLLPEEQREALAIELATRDLRATFDLERGPRLRATLIRLSAAEQRLYVVMHYLIMDAVPAAQLLGELYAATHRRGALLPPAWQYADYAAWQHDAAARAASAQPAVCWKQVLAGGPTLELPGPRSRSRLARHGGARRRLRLPRDLVDHLRALGRRSDPTLFTTLLAAFSVLLSRYAGSGGVVIGTAAAGRSHPEVGQLLGRFIDLLPIRIHPLAPPSFRGLIAEVRRSLLEALDPRDPLDERGVEVVDRTRAPGAGPGPLFQVAFAIEPTSTVDGGGPPAPDELDTGAATLELSLELDERPHGILLSMRAATDRFDSWMIAQLVNVRSAAMAHRLDRDPRAVARIARGARPVPQAGASHRRASRRRAGRRTAAGACASRRSRRGRIRPVTPAAGW